MADGDLTSADLATAFVFGRSESGDYRDATGALVTAAPGVARFDHDAQGQALGLLVGAGTELGGGDRLAIDALALPADLFDPLPLAGDVTVFHRFDPGTGEQRRAWYSRNVLATIDALMRQPGHHRELGVVRGFRENLGGLVHFRGAAWQLPRIMAAGATALGDGEGRALIQCGAEPG